MNTGPINAVLQHIRHLAAIEEYRGHSDSGLLERFLATKEEAAFAALLQRHGPLVWRVCHRVLQHRQNAEDIFQATFLTLAHKASSIRKQPCVASWLHGVAYRLARRLRADLARQRQLADRSAREAEGTTPDSSEQSGARELQGVLDEELTRLQEKHRIPLILCYLEGKTRDEAAQQLGWSIRTLKRRLQEGRKLLAQRLSRRGISLGVAALTAGLLQNAAVAAVSPAVVGSTCKAASLIAAGKSAAEAVSSQVVAITDAMVRSMFMTKMKMTAAIFFVLLTLGGGVALWASWCAEPGEDQPALAQRRDDDGRDDDDRRRLGKAKPQVQPKAEPGDPVKRGEYLVNITRCGDCHTPRTKTGELDMSKHLQGAPIWFVPKIRPKGELADRANDITMSGRAGTWSEAKMVKFLSTGGKADFPMPRYYMTVEDASAVAAYLRSLPGRKTEAKKRDD